MSEHVPSSRDLLKAFLAASDARCPSCRYALRGCTSDKCPECGLGLSLQVATRVSGGAWWMTAIIGLSISAALSLLLLGGLAAAIFAELRNPGLRASVQAGFAPRSELVSYGALTTAGAILSLVIISLGWVGSMRQRYIRMSARKQVAIGMLAAASPLIVCYALGVYAVSF
jgi:hypothetical protein